MKPAGAHALSYRIVPTALEYVASFRETADAVFRESRMFAFHEAPPPEQFAEFVSGVLRDGDIQFVATAQGKVIGWCDVLRKPRPAMRHAGVLGIGVLQRCRGQGVGTALMATTLAAARERSLKRIELHVRTDNEAAKKLYEKFGFIVEGALRKHVLLDGVYHDSLLMSLLID